MTSRTAIQDFSTANDLYVNAVVSFYTVLNGAKTDILATLYSSLSGTTQAANPQTLDSYGKFKTPIYTGQDVIATVTGLGNTPDHDTGVIALGGILTGTGSPEGVITAPIGTLYLRTDGGAGTSLYVKESGVGNSGWAGK